MAETMNWQNDTAVVLLSGGQDSTTCLAWALDRFKQVATIAFDYGQRHRVELSAAQEIAQKVGVIEHRELTVDSLNQLGGNALCGDGANEAAIATDPETSLPTTFVPGRNVLFLTLAAAWAWQLRIPHLVTGVCQTDFSGYPDCRESTMIALQASLRAGMDAPFEIHTPLMHLTKAETVHMMVELGQLDLLALSHTCYRGERPPCGTCPACELRAKGFAEAGYPDPLLVKK